MNELTAKDLKLALKVIKAAKKLGVTKLKIGTLEFEIASQNSDEHEPRVSRPTSKASAKKIAETNARSKDQAEFNDANEELSVMHVEDPAKFEQALIENDFADGGEIIEETYSQ